MEWGVEYTDEFNTWWEGLTEAEQTLMRSYVCSNSAAPRFAVLMRGRSTARGTPT
jgi:hypothetical protein